MQTDVKPALNLAQAKELVALLEAGKQAEADALFAALKDAASDELFQSVGKLTRQLHNSLQDFQLNLRFEQLTSDDLPDAKNRLSYVIEKTEEAANRTMDAVEASLPLAEQLNQELGSIRPSWNRLMTRSIELQEFKPLCHQVEAFLSQAQGSSEHLHMLLTEVLMAQDFQDLTGQVIRRVIALVQEVEESLVDLLTVFGSGEPDTAAKKVKPVQAGVEGPVINPEARLDVVTGQDEVDDLLSDLGF